MISGSLVALVTPMLENGSIDWDKLDALLTWHIEEGTSAIVTVGTTGESATLTVSEHCELIRHTIARVNGAIPVIAGTGANTTADGF
jgi:4-hydroxy-tetrahydrodipicolinate synthase